MLVEIHFCYETQGRHHYWPHKNDQCPPIILKSCITLCDKMFVIWTQTQVCEGIFNDSFVMPGDIYYDWDSDTNMLVHIAYFQRIRSNDFTGHGRLGTVEDAFPSKFVDINSQIFLDVLARFPVNTSTRK